MPTSAPVPPVVTTAAMTAMTVAMLSAAGVRLAASGAEAAPPAPESAARVVHHTTAADRSAALRYWTTKRMAHAVAPRVARTPARPHAGPRASRGRRPAPPAPGGPVNVSGAPWAAGGAVRATTGKVFFTIDGGDFVCSAGSVTSANRDVVVTAGHCVRDAGGVWARNWIYVPGYDHGRRPYGTFTARHMFVPPEWSTRGEQDYDVAMVALATAGGRHVADAAGAQHIAFDQPRGAVVYGFGYPVGGRYDGERLTYCSGRAHIDQRRTTRDQALHCDLAEGASGGPWLTRFDAATGTGVVTSLNSLKYSDDPATMYGPYFGAEIRRVYEQAQRA